ncbi:MAG: ribosomal protein S19 family protein [Candidatus Micrarchaeota archaeon]|nr:ribosomal protein S19 family protein [Candidatus Micrarchaeota archaeon]
MPRVDKFRGLGKEELSKMPAEQALPLLSARARRAVKRALENKSIKIRNFMRRVAQAKSSGDSSPIRTHLREAVILPEWLGMTFSVYNGKEWKNVVISVDKIGYRLGDFSHTTGRVIHSGPGVGATRGSKFIPLK